MAKRRRVRLSRSHFTPILTETLPFEVPVSFSNVGLYEYLISTGASFSSSGIELGPRDDAKYLISTILFGRQPAIEQWSAGATMSVKFPLERTSPLQYRVRHDRHPFRQLSIPHPGSQLAVAHFYIEHGSALLQLLRRPSFSVRSPTSRASVVSVRDSIFTQLEDRSRHGVEVEAREYEYLTSFFKYNEHRFIFRLFSSRRFRRLERRYPVLLSLDVERCFESFYTHTASWAYNGRDRVKAKMRSFASFNRTLGDRLDKLMQSMNDLETRGLLIGPEFSRLFAEVVFQAVDREVERDLAARGLQKGDHYEALRYVDDYFVFAASEEVARRVQDSVDRVLGNYRLYLNPQKRSLTVTPRVNYMDSAKSRVQRVISENLDVILSEDALGTRVIDRTVARTNRIRQDISALIPADGDLVGPISSFAISILEERLSEVLGRVLRYNERRGGTAQTVRSDLVRQLGDLVELYFWLYDLAPRVANAVKVVRSLAEARKACKVLVDSRSVRAGLDSLISSACIATMERFALTEDNSVESLFFLDLLADTGIDVAVAERALAAAGMKREDIPATPVWFNPLVVFELMRLTGARAELSWAHDALVAHALGRVVARKEGDVPDASVAYFALGLLGSPHVEDSVKLEVARVFDKKAGASLARSAADHVTDWFVDWDEIDLHERLLRKRVRDIY